MGADATPPAVPVRVDGHQNALDAAVDTFVAHGSERPASGHALALGRVVLFVLGGWATVSLTDGVGAPWHVADWWAEPVVVEKLVVWALLWQLLGLGRGLAPNAIGALPPVAGLSYWLTPGTVRLAPWPRVPLTSGTRRTVVDVALYGAVLALAAGLLGFTGRAGGTLPASGVLALIVALGLLALRDRSPVAAARPEIVVPLLVAFLLPVGDTVLALKLVLASLFWLGAVTAANRHLPFAVAVALADAPWLRGVDRRRRLWQRDDHDLVPGDVARWTANLLVGLALVLPAVLLFARGGALSTVAVTLTVAVLVALASTLARTGQPELTVLLGFLVVVTYGRYAAVGFDAITAPGPVAALAVALLVLIVAAATAPGLTAWLSPWRQAAGSGSASLWLLRADAAERFDVPVHPDGTAARHYRDLAQLVLLLQGRALDGLLRRAVDDPDDYLVRSHEFMAGATLGWAADLGHHDTARLLAAIQERCGFEPGELRVVTLAAHSTLRTDYRYRVLDAVTGLVEDGAVDVDDMVDRVPWRDPAAPRIPVEVQYSDRGFTGFTAPPEFDVVARPRPAPRTTPPAATPAPRPRPRPVGLQPVGDSPDPRGKPLR